MFNSYYHSILQNVNNLNEECTFIGDRYPYYWVMAVLIGNSKKRFEQSTRQWGERKRCFVRAAEVMIGSRLGKGT